MNRVFGILGLLVAVAGAAVAAPSLPAAANAGLALNTNGVLQGISTNFFSNHSNLVALVLGSAYGSDDNGDGYAFQWFDKTSGRLRAAIRMVADGVDGEHGRFTAAGRHNNAAATNVNLGRFETIDLRRSGGDKRIAIINHRSSDYNSGNGGSGRQDFFTWNATQSRFYVPLHLDEWGKVTLGAGLAYNSGFPKKPTAWVMLPPGSIGQFEAPLKFQAGTNLTTPEDGAMEFDGSHLYFTIAGVRYQIDQQGGGGGGNNFDGSMFKTNASGQVVLANGLTLTNLMARQQGGWAGVHIVSTNAGASLTTNEFALTIQGNQGELGFIAAAGYVIGAWRGDNTGVINYHCTNGQAFYTAMNQNTANAAMLLRGGRAHIGPFGSIFTPKEQLQVMGGILMSNGYFRAWATSTPTASNSQAQVYGKTVGGTTELFTMNSAGQESQLSGGNVTNVLAAASTIDFGSVSAATELENSSTTVTGAADGDPVTLGVPNACMSPGMEYTAWVSAANTVSIRARNNTGSPIDPPSATFQVLVHKRK